MVSFVGIACVCLDTLILRAHFVPQVLYSHPSIVKTYTVDEYSRMENKPRFDIALSISSFEHDGLGRYPPFDFLPSSYTFPNSSSSS